MFYVLGRTFFKYDIYIYIYIYPDACGNPATVPWQGVVGIELSTILETVTLNFLRQSRNNCLRLAMHTQVHKCCQLYIKIHRCVGITLDFLLLFFSVVSYNFVLLLVSFWCSLPPFWAPFGPLVLSFGTLGPSFGALGPQVRKMTPRERIGREFGVQIGRHVEANFRIFFF